MEQYIFNAGAIFTTKSQHKKALIDTHLEFEISNDNYKFLTNLVEVLEPIKSTVEALCLESTNLLMADTAIVFLMQFLKNHKFPIALEFFFVYKKDSHNVEQ